MHATLLSERHSFKSSKKLRGVIGIFWLHEGFCVLLKVFQLQPI